MAPSFSGYYGRSPYRRIRFLTNKHSTSSKHRQNRLRHLSFAVGVVSLKHRRIRNKRAAIAMYGPIKHPAGRRDGKPGKQGKQKRQEK